MVPEPLLLIWVRTMSRCPSLALVSVLLYVTCRIASFKERLEDERKRLAEEEARLLSDYSVQGLQQMCHRGVTSLNFYRRK